MAKLDRVLMKVFGSEASPGQISIFGSLAEADPSFSTDPETIQSLQAYLGGWYSAVLLENSPAIEDMNAIHYLYAYQLAYLMQSGVAEWNDETTYYVGSLASDGAGKIYYSLTDDNINNALSSSVNWKVLASNPLTTKGDVVVSLADGVPSRVAVGSTGQSLFANSGANAGLSYMGIPVVKNFGIDASVAANALTIALKDMSGSNPSAASPICAPFRNSTATVGTYSDALLASALSITVPSTATLGTSGSNAQQYVWVYLINDGGTLDVGVSWTLFDDGTLQNCTQISTGATNRFTLYTASAHTGDKPIRLVGRVKSAQATPGAWVNAPSEVVCNPTPMLNISTNQANAGLWTIEGWNTNGSRVMMASRIGDRLFMNFYGNITTANSTDAGLLMPSTILLDERYFGLNNFTVGTVNRMNNATAFPSTGGGPLPLFTQYQTNPGKIYISGTPYGATYPTVSGTTLGWGSTQGVSFKFDVLIQSWQPYGP